MTWKLFQINGMIVSSPCFVRHTCGNAIRNRLNPNPKCRTNLER